MASPATQISGGKVMLNVFDGTRQSYSDSAKLLITVTDGNKKQVHRDFHEQPSISFQNLPVFDNFGDNYTFLASADHYQDAGFSPVKISPNAVQIVNLMVLPKNNAFNFANAKWSNLGTARPKAKTLFAQGAGSDDAAGDRYSDMEERDGGGRLACLLNITTAADQVHLSQGTLFDCLKELIWDVTGSTAMAQDRFFCWAEPGIRDKLDDAKQQKLFEDAPHSLHPGATRSYKQKAFGEANVQVTLHENDHKPVGGLNCVKVELDIDYFRDPLSHLILEVFENAISGNKTDPRQVYVLRWIAGQRTGIPEFDPLYTIRKA
jgi:hypothetical protein